jgi:hypothetical protein
MLISPAAAARNPQSGAADPIAGRAGGAQVRQRTGILQRRALAWATKRAVKIGYIQPDNLH